MKRKRRRKLRKIDIAGLILLKNRAEIESYRFGKIFSSPEDAGQEYVLRLLEGRHRHATVGQAMIDIAREISGRSGGANHKERINIATAIPVMTEVLDLKPSVSQDVDTSLLFQDLMIGLSQQQRRVIEMFRIGYTFGEMTKELKLSEARIHQIYKRAVKQMKARSERRPILRPV